MTIDELGLEQAKNLLRTLLTAHEPATTSPLPWTLGQSYFIRTVTHHYTGRLVAVYDKEIVLEDCAWVADDGRFAQAVANGSFNEVEPFPDGEVIIGRGSILDATIFRIPLPRSQR